MLQQKLKQYAKIVRIAGIAVLVGLVVVVGYQVYDFYSERVGFTPRKAIESYFASLARGDFAEVYRLTDKEHLSDIYGRPITEGEFMDQVQLVTGDHRMPFQAVQTSKLAEKHGSQYYLVTLTSAVGGTQTTAELTVRVRKDGSHWYITYPFAIIL